MSAIYFTNRKWIDCFCLVFLVIAGGCKKFVQIPPAPNLIVTSQVFSDSADADAAVLGLYFYMTYGPTTLLPYNGGITVYSGLSADELYPTTGSAVGRALEKELYTNAILPTNNLAGGQWQACYQFIYQANAVIENLTGSTTLSSSAHDQLIGEARFVRAMMYFNLVNLFGAVPYCTSTNYEINAVMPRTPVDSVYRGIISDLLQAQRMLPDKYVTAGRVRPNSYTASALLSRAYLYQKDWVNAEITATRIINNSGTYKLMNNLNEVFLSSLSSPNMEAIWQLIPAYPGFETTEGYSFVPGSTGIIPNYVISDFLLSAFEAGDQRKTSWINANTVGRQSYSYPYKYKRGRDGDGVELYMVFRVAEQYLIRAEARAKQGKPDEAMADLNSIRNRAGLPPVSAGTTEELLSAIYHERQIELFCEWGHRWYDLKRTERVNTVMSVVTPSKGGIWDPNWQLYPISQTELNQNHFLTQNPGYH